MIAFYFYLSLEFSFYFQDPNKYLAVLPYEDVYQLFDMLNKFVRPENIPSNVKKHLTTTKRYDIFYYIDHYNEIGEYDYY